MVTGREALRNHYYREQFITVMTHTVLDVSIGELYPATSTIQSERKHTFKIDKIDNLNVNILQALDIR